MAYGGSPRFELLCPICKTFIETNNDIDLQSSLDYHYINVHPYLNDKSQSNKKVQHFKGIKCLNDGNVHPLKECTNYLICPVCENVVEIFQNNINHCFMEHFENFHEGITQTDGTENVLEQRSGTISNRLFESCTNNSGESNYLQNIGSRIEKTGLFGLPQDLEKHKGYVIQNNSHFFCCICQEILKQQQLMEDHLKTKRHEDNIITFLKGKLSNHMHDAMEFVSFYGSNLCCNLCRCKIDMNSNNAHETLVNIISHNASPKHSKSKSHRDTRERNVGHTILQTVSEKNLIINEHKDFIETEMEPHFKCKLCDKIIQCSKNECELEQNFVTHILSILHTKNSKAMSVLHFFKEMNGNSDGEHNFVVSNGSLNCTQCKCTIMANVEQLMEHCQFSATREVSQFSESKNEENVPSPSNNNPLLTKKDMILERHTVTELKNRTSNLKLNSSQVGSVKANKTKSIRRLDIKQILDPLVNQFGNIACIAENEEGNLTCLICNCSIQPTTHCVKMHIMGRFHKNKIHCQIKEFETLKSNEPNREVNLDYWETSRESYPDLIEHLFQALPQKFQEEKTFFTVNMSDGSVNCLLCDCVIDPLFMKTHLQEESHIHKKQLKRA